MVIEDMKISQKREVIMQITKFMKAVKIKLCQFIHSLKTDFSKLEYKFIR